jgi:triacylglycerol lipase
MVRARRAAGFGLAAALIGTAATATASPAASAQEPAPTPGIADEQHDLACSDDVATSTATPVLLVHGTAMTAEENWGTSYAPLLASVGRPVCSVLLPAYSTGDVVTTAEFLGDRIREVSDQAGGRPIDLVGHSQGAYLPRVALRLDPALAVRVDDVVGLAGVYDSGSQRLVDRCRVEDCVTSLHQLRRGSRLLEALAAEPLPTGPDYTNIGTRADTSVTPQPVANQQDGSVAVLVEDVCPGRPVDDQGRDHAVIAGDAVAAALALDALDADGPVDPARLDPAVCAERWYDGFDPDEFMSFAPAVTGRQEPRAVPAEPLVPCALLDDCSDLTARGRMLSAPTVRRVGRTAVVRATARTSGFVRLQVGRRSATSYARPGRTVLLRVVAPRRPVRALVSTRRADDRRWVVEKRQPLRRR